VTIPAANHSFQEVHTGQEGPGLPAGDSWGASSATSYNDAMKRDEVLDTLRAHQDTLAMRFGVSRLALFGSFARDQATDASDIDILVRFDGPATSKSYFGVQFYLEDLLGRPVDLVTDKALRPQFRPYVEREAVDV